MEADASQKLLLRKIPGVDTLLEDIRQDPSFHGIPKTLIRNAARDVISALREEILHNTEKHGDPDFTLSSLRTRAHALSVAAMRSNLVPVVNATGVVVHTNLGRSPLCREALENIQKTTSGYSNLEFDLETGKRGLRYTIVEDLLCEITGAESAMVVNNNAAAVLLCLSTICQGKEAIVSRGELVEIGGSFRIPDVMKRSGAILKEVGTTNRTHLRDYEEAISGETGLMLKVHKSNYAILGFSKEVSLAQMVNLGAIHGIPVMEDLGSGSFIDFSRYGLGKEPTVQESVKADADIVTFSGDKLLGGPQAGIIVGKKKFIKDIQKNALTRALRIDKMTLAGLESTVRLYRDPETAVEKIPTLRMLTSSQAGIQKRADMLHNALCSLHWEDLEIHVMQMDSRVGGGALPLVSLPSACVGIRIRNYTVNRIEEMMRKNNPPVIGRIENNLFIMDARTIADEEIDIIKTAVWQILQKGSS